MLSKGASFALVLLATAELGAAFQAPAGFLRASHRLPTASLRSGARRDVVRCTLSDGKNQEIEELERAYNAELGAYARQRALDEEAAMTRRNMMIGASLVTVGVSAADIVLGASGMAATVAAGGAATQEIVQAKDKAAVAARGLVLEGSIPVSSAFRFADFAPKLVNFCGDLGMAPGDTLPSRAFCSDENQIYAILQMVKNFGCGIFDHGRVGGMVATDRHGPHAGHGKDLVLVSASHVGFADVGEGDAKWGKYRRMQTPDDHVSTSCGMVAGTLAWYLDKYNDAKKRVRIVQAGKQDIRVRIPIDLLDGDRKDGLILNLNSIAKGDPIGRNNAYQEFAVSSVLANTLARVDFFKEAAAKKAEAAKAAGAEEAAKKAAPPKPPSAAESVGFKAPPAVAGLVDEGLSAPIGALLTADTFTFRRATVDRGEPGYFLERHILKNIGEIVTSSAPYLTAALAASQLEFERTCRTLIGNPLYKGKKVLYMSGVNVDMSPSAKSTNALGDTKFLPVASLFIDSNGEPFTMQAEALYRALDKQPTKNPKAIDLEEALTITQALPDTDLSLSPQCTCPGCVCPEPPSASN